MQFHALCVTQICRICCGRLLTTKEKKQKRTAVPCSKYASDIFLVFGINMVAGTSQEAQTTQQASGLRNIPKTTKASILEKAGIQEKMTMDNKTVLSLKEETDLSFKQLRTLKRYMKNAGFKMENEKKSRDLAKTLTVPIETEPMTFFDKEDNESQVPFCRVQITPLVLKMLNTYEQMDLLTNHDGNIPDMCGSNLEETTEKGASNFRFKSST